LFRASSGKGSRDRGIEWAPPDTRARLGPGGETTKRQRGKGKVEMAKGGGGESIAKNAKARKRRVLIIQKTEIRYEDAEFRSHSLWYDGELEPRFSRMGYGLETAPRAAIE
jgi:hypothetical protein